MTAIKISELSIGDWVRYPDADANVRVSDIYSDGHVFIVGEEDSGIGESVNAHHHIEPIPLTPEILEKNGLEYEDDGNDAVIFLCCDMFWARLCAGDTFWQVGIHSEDRLDAVVCNVKHTHQLQHALRLAGVGKEIEV